MPDPRLPRNTRAHHSCTRKATVGGLTTGSARTRSLAPGPQRAFFIARTRARPMTAHQTIAQDQAQQDTISGAEMVVRALLDQGVEVLFGYPGGAVLPIYDALFAEPRLKHVLVRHEQGATHAAEGYARSTGKPGVVLVTSGPGATNAVTGIVDALMDSIPLIVITGQVATHLIGTDAFQECDTIGITRPCTKHNYLVKDVADLPRIIHEAFHIATSGRPGPVVIDIPKDVQFGRAAYQGKDEVTFSHLDPDGPGRLPRVREAVAGDGRHARVLRSQQRHARLRRDGRGRRPLRRPR